MSAGFCNWLAHIKSDDNDIDNGLANDFDGSLSGLGVDMGSNTYNMSEALLALPPVFKQETRLKDGTRLATVVPLSSSLDFSHLTFTTANRNPVTLASVAKACGILGGVMTNSPPIASSSLIGEGPVTTLYQAVSDLTGVNQSLTLPTLHGPVEHINHEWVNLMTSMNLSGEVIEEESNEGRFQYILCAPTSPATRISEETLTYLNQGQSYEIKMKQLKTCNNTNEFLLKSVVRVVFHERRLQYMEREQLDLWRMTRPGERIVDIDIPQSNLLLDVKIQPHRLNCVEFVWDPSRDTSVFIKVHCISTEFTAKKHGGEKGVPFRIQVETYTHPPEIEGALNGEEGVEELEVGGDGSGKSSPQLLHCASCQVKVFKPKGADRKLKTDRDKIEKLVSEIEKGKYQPAYECTVLIEIPLDQVKKYLELLHKQQDEDEKKAINICSGNISGKSPTGLPDSPVFSVGSGNSANGNFDFYGNGEGMSVVLGTVKFSGSGANRQGVGATSSPTLSSGGSSGNGSLPRNSSLNLSSTSAAGSSTIAQSRKRHSESGLRFHSESRGALKNSFSIEEDALSHSASADEVTQWLNTHRFTAFVSTFQNYAGSDLLRLQRDDLIEICGLADGIRLYNALQSKTMRPKLTLYVCQASTSAVDQAHMGHTSPTGSTHSRQSTPSPTLTAYSTGLPPNDQATTPNNSPNTPSPFNSPGIGYSSNETNAAMQSWVNHQQLQHELLQKQNMQQGKQLIQGQQIGQQNLMRQGKQLLESQQFQNSPRQQMGQQQLRQNSPQMQRQQSQNSPQIQQGLNHSPQLQRQQSQQGQQSSQQGQQSLQLLRQLKGQQGQQIGSKLQHSQLLHQQQGSCSPQSASCGANKDWCATAGGGGVIYGEGVWPNDGRGDGLSSNSRWQMEASCWTSGTTTSVTTLESPANNPTSSSRSIANSSKRQMYEAGEVDDDEFTGVVSGGGFKKQRLLDHWQQEVYHALYLEALTERHLADRLAALYAISSACILDILVHEQLGIHVLVTDTVVQNFKDQGRYSVKAVQDTEKCGYHVILKSVEH